MIVPAHWAEARLHETIGGRSVTIRRFGWSDASEDEAQTMADQRARVAMERARKGEKVRRREPKVPYNGAKGVPIREEVVRRQGSLVLTRNSYGAVCLNVPDVLFADIDHDREHPLALTCLLALVGMIAAGWLGWRLVGSTWAVSSGLFAAWGVLVGVPKLRAAWLRLRGGSEAIALRRVRRVVSKLPDALIDVYRTPAGLRLLARDRTWDPPAKETTAFLEALGSDPLYVRMCRRQNCFRARLTPKPWRIGLERRLRPNPGVWPVAEEYLPGRRAWVRDYVERAGGFASVRFLETLGEAPEVPAAAAVKALHDELSRAHADLPLA